MGDLRDELVKTGLVSSKRAKELAHKEKSRKNKAGKKKVGEERRARDADRLARAQSRSASDRERELARQDSLKDGEERSRITQLIRDHAVDQGVRGPRRFHFINRDDKLPFLELNDDTCKRLEHGELTICEVPDSRPTAFLLVPQETARKVHASAPEYVLFNTAS